MKRTYWIILFAVLAMGLTACGGGAAAETAEFTIEMSEFVYSPETIEVSVGQEVTLHIVNNGALEHEVMIGKEVITEDGQPANYEHNMFEKHSPSMVGEEAHEDGDDHAEDEHMDEAEDEHMEGEEHADDEHMEGDDHADSENAHTGDAHGFMVSVPGNSKETTTITFTVTEDMVGEWEIGCFFDAGSHYAAGMTGTFIVTP